MTILVTLDIGVPDNREYYNIASVEDMNGMIRIKNFGGNIVDSFPKNKIKNIRISTADLNTTK